MRSAHLSVPGTAPRTEHAIHNERMPYSIPVKTLSVLRAAPGSGRPAPPRAATSFPAAVAAGAAAGPAEVLD
ncbi:hypothetical protein GCM10009859_03460 [Kocuria salsicia]